MNKTQQKETLDRWLAEHAGIFYKLVRVHAFSHHDQEDLFQEIVIQVWKSIPNYNATAKESTYIYQVALFAALAWSRKESRRTEQLEAATEISQLSIFHPEPCVDPRVDWLYEQLAKMNLIDRSLMLLLLEGYRYREIATLLGLSESNVGSRLTRLKHKIAATNIQENVT